MGFFFGYVFGEGSSPSWSGFNIGSFSGTYVIFWFYRLQYFTQPRFGIKKNITDAETIRRRWMRLIGLLLVSMEGIGKVRISRFIIRILIIRIIVLTRRVMINPMLSVVSENPGQTFTKKYWIKIYRLIRLWQKMTAYRLHRLGWTQEEQAEAIGYKSKGSYQRDFCSHFPGLEIEVKKVLDSGM